MSELEMSIKLPDESSEKHIYTKEVKHRIMRRVGKIGKYLAMMGIEKFYIGGGAMLREKPNDYDIYPVLVEDFSKLNHVTPGYYNETINSKTFKFENGNIKIQWCNFHRGSLGELVEGFDFSHIKLGATFRIMGGATYGCQDVYISKDYWRGRVLGRSYYCPDCNSYPLNSLLRVFKYWERGAIKHPHDVIFNILAQWLERGYSSREDFLTQLAAIDVSLSDMKKIRDTKNKNALKTIFKNLHKPSDGNEHDSRICK